MPNYTNFAFLKYFEKPEDALKALRASEKFSFGRSQRELFADNKVPGPTDVVLAIFSTSMIASNQKIVLILLSQNLGMRSRRTTLNTQDLEPTRSRVSKRRAFLLGNRNLWQISLILQGWGGTT